MYIKTIVLNTNGIISSSLLSSFMQKSVLYAKARIFPRSRWVWPKTTFPIMDSADSWVNVSGDLVEYSGSGILFSTYVMTATDRKKLRNLARATDFFANWAINTELVYLENFYLVNVYQRYSVEY